jgi:hypothetical protein
MGLTALTHKHLLLCEGMHDVQFFQHLAQARGLPAFQATSCGNVVGAAPGRDGIQHLTGALNALPALPTFYTKLESILIVADNDGDHAKALRTVQQYINEAVDIGPGHRYMAPTTPQVTVGANPAVTILMLPWTALPGALDTLCLAAARNKEPAVATCVDAFETCINPVDWGPQKVAKMKLRAHISAAYPTDPYISPAWVWRDNTDLVPLNDPVFDQVEQFLRVFLV